MAKDALGLHLYSLEEDNDEIPIPTPINKICIEPNQVVIHIHYSGAKLPRELFRSENVD